VTYRAAIVWRGLLIVLSILGGLPLVARASSPAASDAAGGKIAFLRTGGDSDTGDIYPMNADGTGERNLTRHPAVNGAPSWSPDGRRITFDSFRCPPNAARCDSTIFVMNADGTGQHRLTRRPGDRSPAWSPSGDRIAFARQVPEDRNYEIFVMKPTGQERVG
jgi:Tol biopolymer transport system component